MSIDNSIVEGNKVIAVFMKIKFNNGMWFYNGYGKFPSDLSYHSSWDWLMPACKKFDKLNLLDKEYERLCDEIDNAVSCYEIKAAFRNFVKAIEWYNSNQKQKS